MKSNKKAIIICTAIAVVIFVIYKILDKPSKDEQIKYLIDNNFSQGSTLQLSGMGDNYILIWYMAAKAKSPTFTLGGKKYNTNGGKVVQ